MLQPRTPATAGNRARRIKASRRCGVSAGKCGGTQHADRRSTASIHDSVCAGRLLILESERAVDVARGFSTRGRRGLTWMGRMTSPHQCLTLLGVTRSADKARQGISGEIAGKLNLDPTLAESGGKRSGRYSGYGGGKARRAMPRRKAPLQRNLVPLGVAVSSFVLACHAPSPSGRYSTTLPALVDPRVCPSN